MIEDIFRLRSAPGQLEVADRLLLWSESGTTPQSFKHAKGSKVKVRWSRSKKSQSQHLLGMGTAKRKLWWSDINVDLNNELHNKMFGRWQTLFRCPWCKARSWMTYIRVERAVAISICAQGKNKNCPPQQYFTEALMKKITIDKEITAILEVFFWSYCGAWLMTGNKNKYNRGQ